jgi:hypothetical protein
MKSIYRRDLSSMRLSRGYCLELRNHANVVHACIERKTRSG